MSVDFTRTIVVRKNGNTYSYFGMDTTPSSGIGFRSQGATRYVSLTSGNEKTNHIAPLRCVRAGYVVKASGVSVLTARIQCLKVTGADQTQVRIRGITGVSEPFSVNSSISFQLSNSSGTVLYTKNYTLNAGATSVTSTTNAGIFDSAEVYCIKVTVTVNGRIYYGWVYNPRGYGSDYIDYYFPVTVVYAPLVDTLSYITIKFYAFTGSYMGDNTTLQFAGTGAITSSKALSSACSITMTIPNVDESKNVIVTETLSAGATSKNSTVSKSVSRKSKEEVQVTVTIGNDYYNSYTLTLKAGSHPTDILRIVQLPFYGI